MLYTLQFRHDSQPRYCSVANLQLKVCEFRLPPRSSWDALCWVIAPAKCVPFEKWRIQILQQNRLCEQKIRWNCVTYLTDNSLEVWLFMIQYIYVMSGYRISIKLAHFWTPFSGEIILFSSYANWIRNILNNGVERGTEYHQYCCRTLSKTERLIRHNLNVVTKAYIHQEITG